MSNLYQEVLLMSKPAGEHMVWRNNGNSITKDGVVYNVRRVLMKDDDRTHTYQATCGLNGCILPQHLKLRVVGSHVQHTHCLFCSREMRPYKVPKSTAPHTIAKASNGLCQTCYKAGYGIIGKDSGVEELNDIQVALVKRKVPEDLWSYFGV